MPCMVHVCEQIMLDPRSIKPNAEDLGHHSLQDRNDDGEGWSFRHVRRVSKKSGGFGLPIPV